jgi:hypothetical protein
MTQALYAHMNNIRKKSNHKKRNCTLKKVQQMMKLAQSNRTNQMRNDLFTTVLTSAQ